MNKSDQHTAKHSLAGAVALALFVLGGTSILAPAFATHELGHDEIARGKIGALEERVWSCENDFAPCKSPVGPQGAQGPEGPEGPLGPQGQQGDPGFDGPLADLVCAQGQTVAFDEIYGWQCADGGGAGQETLRTIFVTSESFTADLATNGGGVDGLSGADNLCQEAAEADGSIVPEGDYVAFLSTSTVDARDRFPSNSPGYILSDGRTLIATSKDDLLDGEIFQVLLDEAGGSVTSDCTDLYWFSGCAWSNSNADGTKALRPYTDSCEDFTTDFLFNTGSWAADPTSFDPFQSGEQTLLKSCESSQRLYCIQR